MWNSLVPVVLAFQDSAAAAAPEPFINPLIVLAIGIVTVIGLILALRVNAFIALITAAMLVSLLAPGETGEKISRVAVAFGNACGGIGIVIALAAVIGKCMMDSGAADKVVRSFLNALGEKRAPLALMGSGYVLSVPVFFDTVFYLLVPLARSLYRKTQHNYLQYILAIAAGGALTHTLVPPTPGPLFMAANLGIDVGMMILVGGIVAIPAAFVGLLFAKIDDRLMNIPMRAIGSEQEPDPFDDSELPSLTMSLLPVVLPVLMITANTVVSTLAKDAADGSIWLTLEPYAQLIGNANLALMVSTVIALYVLYQQRKPTLAELSHTVEMALMSGGVIILITAGGGAFGAMLKEAQIGPAIQDLFRGQGDESAGLTFLFLGFGIASLLKVAQGSGTVSMITTSSMLASMLITPENPEITSEALGFNPVYLATAIGAGSLVGSWMNDSGFWIFTKMGGLTESESLRSWTLLLSTLGIVSMAVTVLLVFVLPLA